MRICCYCANPYDGEICPNCGHAASDIPEQAGVLPYETRAGENNRYIICRVLGQGGFGITYLGYDSLENRRVAIKEYFPSGLAIRNTDRLTIIASNTGTIPAFKAGVVKFFEEGEMLTRYANQKNIVTIYDLFYANDTAYIVMEYIDGTSLGALIKSHGPLDEKSLLPLILPVTDALIAVHRDGVLHRDISPSNILVTSDGNVRLIDFGAARAYSFEHSNSLSIILKGGYAPLEQYTKHGNQGPWTDVYALCATVYYCVTGRIPEQATDRIDVDCLEPPSKLGARISRELDELIMCGMAFRSADRIQSMEELKRGLESVKAKSDRVIAQAEKTVAYSKDVKIPVKSSAKAPKSSSQKQASAKKSEKPNKIIAMVAALLAIIAITSGDRKSVV